MRSVINTICYAACVTSVLVCVGIVMVLIWRHPDEPRMQMLLRVLATAGVTFLGSALIIGVSQPFARPPSIDEKSSPQRRT